MIKKRLVVKLFLSYLAVLLVAMLVLVLATQIILPQAFNRHLADAVGNGTGRRLGQPDLPHPFFVQFRDGVNEAIFWAGTVAVFAAGIISWLLSRRIVEPVREMQRISRYIAEGHFESRVPVTSQDELGDLAHSFNRMAEDLEEVEARRQRLIGDVAHELRTPLTAIKGYMEGLIDGVLPADAETFAQIYNETERLSRLVDDLQELSRIEAGAFQLQMQPVSLRQAVQTVRKRLGYQFQEKALDLQTEAVPEDVQVLADPDRLLQILTNLLGNALRYTPSGGVVRVRAQKDAEGVTICVEDTGIGIAPEDLPHLFDRFYRADASRSRRYGGSGIGLTVVKHLAEAMGGRAWAESEGLGQGSRFCVHLQDASASRRGAEFA